MNFVIGILTFLLLLDCLLLVLLVLIQLPKKEAGMGLAFGAGATDALFGAGGGNALTKLTKYAAGIFLGLVFFLYVVSPRAMKTTDASSFQEKLKQQQKALEEARPVALPTNSIPAVAPSTNKPTAAAPAAPAAPPPTPAPAAKPN